MGDPRYPDVAAATVRLRFTLRALDDLQVATGLAPAEIVAIRASTPWPAIVDEFVRTRSSVAAATRVMPSPIGCPAVQWLDSAASGRAATWFDRAHSVRWFLAFAPRRDVAPLEDRAAAGDLLPGMDDLRLLELDDAGRELDTRVAPGLRILAAEAVRRPRQVQRGRVGDLLRLDVAAVVEQVGPARRADLYLSVRLPLLAAGASRPPGWPAERLAERLAELATGCAQPVVEVPSTMPLRAGERRVDPANELAVVVRHWELEPLEPESVAGFVTVREAELAPFLERVGRAAERGRERAGHPTMWPPSAGAEPQSPARPAGPAPSI